MSHQRKYEILRVGLAVIEALDPDSNAVARWREPLSELIDAEARLGFGWEKEELSALWALAEHASELSREAEDFSAASLTQLAELIHVLVYRAGYVPSERDATSGIPAPPKARRPEHSKRSVEGRGASRTTPR